MTPTPTSQHHSSGSSDTKCETVDLAPRIGAWYGPAAAQYSVGDGPLQLDPERRAARRFLRPSARGELQTTGKPRMVLITVLWINLGSCVESLTTKEAEAMEEYPYAGLRAPLLPDRKPCGDARLRPRRVSIDICVRFSGS